MCVWLSWAGTPALPACLLAVQAAGVLLQAAQAFDSGHLPQGWPEPELRPQAGAAPAMQSASQQQGGNGGRDGSGGTGGHSGGSLGGGGGGGPGGGGCGTKRKADGPPAPGGSSGGGCQPGGAGWEAAASGQLPPQLSSASGYPGVYRLPTGGGWFGRIKLRSLGRKRITVDVLRDSDAQVVAVGRELALFWATHVARLSSSASQQQPSVKLRDR